MLRCVRVRMHVAPRAARLASPLGAPDLYIPIAMNLTCGSQCSLTEEGSSEERARAPEERVCGRVRVGRMRGACGACQKRTSGDVGDDCYRVTCKLYGRGA